MAAAGSPCPAPSSASRLARAPSSALSSGFPSGLAVSAGGVDLGDDLGRSALSLAVEAGHANCVEQLITRSANISHADHAQQTPMSIAAAAGHEAIVQAMLQYKLAQDEKLLQQIDVGDD